MSQPDWFADFYEPEEVNAQQFSPSSIDRRETQPEIATVAAPQEDDFFSQFEEAPAVSPSKNKEEKKSPLSYFEPKEMFRKQLMIPAKLAEALVGGPGSASTEIAPGYAEAAVQYFNPEIPNVDMDKVRREGLRYIPSQLQPFEGEMPPEADEFWTGNIGPGLDVLPTIGELKGLEKGVKEFTGVDLEPRDSLEEAVERGLHFAGGAGVGGVPGLVAGGAVGLGDYLAEKAGIAPFIRQTAILGAPIAKAGAKKAVGALKTKTGSLSEIASNAIKIRDQNLNLDTLEAIDRLGLENVPIQAYTKGGIMNLLEGATGESYFGQKAYNDLTNSFTKDLTNQLVQNIESISPIDLKGLPEGTFEKASGPMFKNELPDRLDRVSTMKFSNRDQSGRTVKDYLENVESKVKSKQHELYKNVDEIIGNLELEPASKEYNGLRAKILRNIKDVEGKGFIGGREEAVRVLRKTLEMFEEGEPVQVRDIWINKKAYNKKINYENPDVINLIEPTQNAMRDVLNEKLGEPYQKAENLVQIRQRLLTGNKLIKKFRKATPSQAFDMLKDPAVLDAFQDIFRLGGKEGQEMSGMIRRHVLEDVLGDKLITAKSPKDFSSGLTPAKNEQLTNLARHYPEAADLRRDLLISQKSAQQHTTPSALFKSKILKDVVTSLAQNELPAFTLQQMKNPTTFLQVKDALTQTAHGKPIYDALRRAAVEKLYSPAFDIDGTLNLKKMNEISQTNKPILDRLMDPKQKSTLMDIYKVSRGLEEGSMANTTMKRRGGQFTDMGLAYQGLKAVGASIITASPIPLFGIMTEIQAVKVFSKVMTDPAFSKTLLEKSKKIAKNPNAENINETVKLIEEAATSEPSTQ